MSEQCTLSVPNIKPPLPSDAIQPGSTALTCGKAVTQKPRSHGLAGFEDLTHRQRRGLRLGEQFQGPIDLLVTDVVMPHMDGPELVRRLSLYRPALRVLYMSGYTYGITTQTGMQRGLLEDGVAFLQKPFTPSALSEKVREVLDRSVATSKS